MNNTMTRTLAIFAFLTSATLAIGTFAVIAAIPPAYADDQSTSKSEGKNNHKNVCNGFAVCTNDSTEGSGGVASTGGVSGSSCRITNLHPMCIPLPTP